MTVHGSSAALFAGLPDGLRADLLAAFDEIVTNYAQSRWEPAELNGGKLCEVAYSIVRGQADGQLPERASKPRNMVDACRALEREEGLPRSLRLQIPRMIPGLYEMRNNRNVGHVGGDVDPSHMDASLVLNSAKWLMAELIRVFHDLPVEQASEAVEALVEREVPLVWKVGGTLRILDTSMSMREKTLVVLLASPGPLTDRELVDHVEHSNPSVYRRSVLKVAHNERLLEYDSSSRVVTISPLGIAAAEKLVEERARTATA